MKGKEVGLTVLFCEASSYTFGMLEKLGCAVLNACILLGAECFARKIVAAGCKAALNQAGVEVHKVLHLLLLDHARHGRLLGTGHVGNCSMEKGHVSMPGKAG